MLTKVEVEALQALCARQALQGLRESRLHLLVSTYVSNTPGAAREWLERERLPGAMTHKCAIILSASHVHNVIEQKVCMGMCGYCLRWGTAANALK